MELKQYQTNTLSLLRRFFEEARIAGPQNAFDAITKEPEIADRLGRYAGSYTTPFEDRLEVPYVCLRLPTGGGKTILGAHAVGVARDAWIEKDYPLVVWLVPTNTIRLQTAQALKNPAHSYREVLDNAFGGRVRVFDISDFTHIRPQDLRDYCCIVVGTVQTLRVTNTEGRKVYAHNENLESHFSILPKSVPGLERMESGGTKFSFANLLHLHRPLMIVDEAHNAVTRLSREMQGRLNPCAIIEFTATPSKKSNVLYTVTAQELKDEEMIKLPIVLSENDTWQNAVNGAVAKRAELAEYARNEDGFGRIRPIVLFQAQNRNQEVNVATLRNHLLNVECVPESSIAVATGDQRELDGIDLFDPKCPIEYVITVEALKEGWDCSFAYVFCSVSRIQSAQNVEQLFGRVLRMPYAKKRQFPALNKAYAYVSEPSFGDAARALVDKLVKMGFEEEEAKDSIAADGQGVLGFKTGGDLIDLGEDQKPVLRHRLPASPGVLLAVGGISLDGLSVRETGDGWIEIAVPGGIDAGQEKSIVETFPDGVRRALSSAIKKYRTQHWHVLSPAERGEKLNVPRLMTEIQGSLEFADSDTFMEYHEWSLVDHPAKLDESEFTIWQTERRFEIDIAGRRVRYNLIGQHEQLALNVSVEGWTPENLAIWLDRQVHDIDLNQNELIWWLSNLILYLIRDRGMHITALTRCKYLLARVVREKIERFRVEERERAYQRFLSSPEGRVEISFDTAFEFRNRMYSGQSTYRGRWKPSRHFLGPDKVPAFDGAEDGEEVQCARILDSLSSVKYWVRNVARHPNSFWLPTVTGKFYPDFLALLNDGRFFVVEYKGAHIAEGSDTAEKRTIGELWERHSEGKGIFLVVEKQRDGLDMRGQLEKKIADDTTRL